MACGLALAVPMAFAMRATFVAKVNAADPMVFLPTISVLLALGIFAAVVPALRASRIDPIVTLRQE
jgi:ABC-type antimicrobial peptide transport system permease subunit